LIIADLMKKFPNIPKRIEEDYHSIKDDVPLETDEFKEYETVFMKVTIPINQLQPVVSTQGMNRNTPRAHRSPTVFANPPKTKKRKQTAKESSSPRKSLKITIKQKKIVDKDNDDSKDRIKPGSHKENHEFVDDGDDKEEEKQNDDMGSLEIWNEETQTTIHTPPSSPRKILSSDKKINQKLTDIVSIPTTTTSKHSHVKKRISSKYSHLPDRDAFRLEVSALVSQEFNAHAPAIIEELFKSYVQSNVEALRRKFEKSSPFIISCMEDDFHSQHDEHQEDDVPPEREKRVKRSKKSKRSKSARGSSSKHSSKDSTKYVPKQQSQQQKWDLWGEDNVIDEDEVIPEDETPELIAKFHNIDKHVLTIFDHARMEATLRDTLSNQYRNAEEYAYHLEQSTNFMKNQIVWESRQQDILCTVPKTLIFYGPQRNPNEPPRCLYNKDLFFLKYGNTKEKKYIFSLYKIHAEEFLEPDLEEKIKKVVRIVTDQPSGLDFMDQILVMGANDKPDNFSKVDFKYLNKKDIEDLYYVYQSKKVVNQKIKLMNSLITFIRSCVIWERVHDFQLGIKSYQIKVNLTAPTLTFHGIEEHAPYSIVDELDTCLIYLNNKDEKRVMYLVEIVKFCDATLEKVLKGVKLRMFESKFLKKLPLLGNLDQDIMKAYEREISMRLSH
ncbi:hypothetical protein Tco_0174562, partial [Tanacetum coccineum]